MTPATCIDQNITGNYPVVTHDSAVRYFKVLTFTAYQMVDEVYELICWPICVPSLFLIYSLFRDTAAKHSRPTLALIGLKLLNWTLNVLFTRSFLQVGRGSRSRQMPNVV